MTLGMLVDGKWVTDWTERDAQGRFNRMPTHFRNWITADGSSGFKAEPNRYHLYVSLGCPWAHRTAIIWKLQGLEKVITLSIVDPVITEDGYFLIIQVAFLIQSTALPIFRKFISKLLKTTLGALLYQFFGINKPPLLSTTSPARSFGCLVHLLPSPRQI